MSLLKILQWLPSMYKYLLKSFKNLQVLHDQLPDLPSPQFFPTLASRMTFNVLSPAPSHGTVLCLEPSSSI